MTTPTLGTGYDGPGTEPESWELTTFDETRLKAPAPRHELAAGLRIGPYAIERELGRGGMGTVYLAARADEAFEKKVAIKVTRGTLGSPEAVSRFKRERQILARIEHPNVARLLDGGATDDGLPYIVMEYIEGSPLHLYCDERRLSTAARLKLFLTVCSAVDYAHHKLIVHRDLKPGNILVTADGVPHLLDFGIAKLIDPNGLGLYDRGAALARAALAFRRQVADRDPQALAHTLNLLGNILMDKGELKQAEAVYRESLDLYRRLHGNDSLEVAKMLNNLSSVVDPQGRSEESDRLLLEALAIKRRRLGPDDPNLATTLANIGVNLYRRGDIAGSEVRLREALAIQRKAFGEDHPEVAFSMQQVAVLLDEQGRYQEAEQAYRDALAIQRRVLGQEHPDIVPTLTNLANTLSHAGRLDAAEPVYLEALPMSRKLFGPETTDTAHVLAGLADLERRRGRLAEAEAAARASLAIREKQLGAEHADAAESLASLGRVLLDAGRYADSEKALLRAAELMDKQPTLESRRRDVRDALRQLSERWGRPAGAARER